MSNRRSLLVADTFAPLDHVTNAKGFGVFGGSFCRDLLLHSLGLCIFLGP